METDGFNEQKSTNTKKEPLIIRLFYVNEVGVRRLELPASSSRTTRATNCATPRKPKAKLVFLLISIRRFQSIFTVKNCGVAIHLLHWYGDVFFRELLSFLRWNISTSFQFHR